MHWVITALLIVVGVINFLPLMGVLSADKLNMLYGTAISDPNMEILMRHRAVLFGVVGGFVIAAAFVPAWQWLAITAALVSMVSFLLLGYLVGGYNAEIAKIITIDWVAIVLALGAAILKFTYG